MAKRYEIVYAPQAVEDQRSFRKSEQATIVEAIEEQLRHQPDVATRNRKQLRHEHISEWELRIGTIRVFYDVDRDAAVVRITVIGYKKGNKLFVRGEEFSS
jgi:mRNA-degrading endonuclease RelE of RelBE toxin-antitoxin system